MNSAYRWLMKRLALLVLVGACLLAAGASAQEWPARPVRIVNTFAPGGAADILARIVADHLSGAFKQQFFVETPPIPTPTVTSAAGQLRGGTVTGLAVSASTSSSKTEARAGGR
jgi:hypothetical protein